MKLFKSLLVAPATLGLLAPMSATANEVTINDFNPAEELAITNSRVDGLEARLNNFEAGGFSDTTTASFGVNFYVGAVDGGTVATSTPGATTANLTTGAVTTAAPTAGTAAAEAVTFSYDYAMDLSTSFTGEDSLNIAIIGGNAAGTPVDAFMGGDDTADALVLDGISYTFPLGNAPAFSVKFVPLFHSCIYIWFFLGFALSRFSKMICIEKMSINFKIRIGRIFEEGAAWAGGKCRSHHPQTPN